MEQKRRCGWLRPAPCGSPAVVWARRGARAESCPVSSITPERIALLEKFHAWKASSGVNLIELPARDAEAFLLLDEEVRKEMIHARQHDS
ncbi:MAG: hypothetical protein FJW39_03740 [Acidobacteria bacterium]|nr:hypothetical protein [Acidobacteriota bacterium]